MKLINADGETENFDASLINSSIIDEIELRLEEIEDNRPLTHGDGNLATLLEGVKSNLNQSQSVEQTSGIIYDLTQSVSSTNSRFAPKVKQALYRLLSFLQEKYNPQAKIGKLKIATIIREIFAQVDGGPRREDNTYQSSPIGQGTGVQEFTTSAPQDDRTMSKGDDQPKVEQVSTSMNPLIGINTEVHELDDLISRAIEKATSAQHKSLEYTGGNVQVKSELVNSISTLVRRLQNLQKMTSYISYSVNKKLKL